jgi:hypothetical protein
VHSQATSAGLEETDKKGELPDSNNSYLHLQIRLLLLIGRMVGQKIIEGQKKSFSLRGLKSDASL